MTVSLSDVLPLAGRAMDAEGRVEPGLLCRLARVYGCADSRAAVEEAVRAERRAGGILVDVWLLRCSCGGRRMNVVCSVASLRDDCGQACQRRTPRPFHFNEALLPHAHLHLVVELHRNAGSSLAAHKYVALRDMAIKSNFCAHPTKEYKGMTYREPPRAPIAAGGLYAGRFAAGEV